jgi:hypothetical protein
MNIKDEACIHRRRRLTELGHLKVCQFIKCNKLVTLNGTSLAGISVLKIFHESQESWGEARVTKMWYRFKEVVQATIQAGSSQNDQST